ncbi:hypothetical protein D3C72_655380 [compost metagenome]
MPRNSFLKRSGFILKSSAVHFLSLLTSILSKKALKRAFTLALLPLAASASASASAARVPVLRGLGAWPQPARRANERVMNRRGFWRTGGSPGRDRG